MRWKVTRLITKLRDFKGLCWKFSLQDKERLFHGRHPICEVEKAELQRISQCFLSGYCSVRGMSKCWTTKCGWKEACQRQWQWCQSFQATIFQNYKQLQLLPLLTLKLKESRLNPAIYTFKSNSKNGFILEH